MFLWYLEEFPNFLITLSQTSQQARLRFIKPRSTRAERRSTKMQMNIFVAGGTGVLGRASLRSLVEAGHRVRSSARGKEKAELVRSLGAEPVNVDLYEIQSVRQAVKGMDAVLRLTTKFGAMAKLRDPRTWAETMRLRTEGAHVLVDAAIAEGVPTYVHESVAFLYADGGTSWLTEDAPTDDGGTALLRATLEGDREAGRFTQAGGRGIVLRFGGFYGADAPSTRETVALARRRLMPQFGPGSNYFASIYVPDAGRAVLASLGVPAGTYNVCDDEPVTFADYLVWQKPLELLNRFACRACWASGCLVTCGHSLRGRCEFRTINSRRSRIGSRPYGVFSMAGQSFPRNSAGRPSTLNHKTDTLHPLCLHNGIDCPHRGANSPRGPFV
jgi:nucleoside-diphosphate-sugar epimerase